MPYKISLEKLNDVFFRVNTEQFILAEMSEYFTFKVPGAQFHPKVKARQWDGRMRLLNRLNNTIYVGLIDRIKEFAEERGYPLEHNLPTDAPIDESIVNKWIESLNLPFVPHDYQRDAFLMGIQNKRLLIISPTASGKTLIAYLLTRWFLQLEHYKVNTKKALIIVPTLNLVAQGYKDFLKYAKNDSSFTEKHIHTIYSGQEKETTAPIIISTWQSLHRLPQSFFNQFDFVLVDEAQNVQANSLKNILTKCINVSWRFGTTGTLQGAKCHEMVISGLTGPIYRATTSKELMDEGKLATLKINCIVLKHNEANCKKIKKFQYAEEMAFIISEHQRNKFIRNLAVSMKGNSLVLFQYIAHGKRLFEDIKQKCEKECPARKIFLVYGGTDMEDRENVRSITENEKDSITVASVGVFSAGADMPNLESVIFASPSKSRIRTLQSIGRGLRVGKTGKCSLYDMVDDLCHKRHKNFATKHFLERVAIYDSEQFIYNIYSIDLK